jgi:small subunit ribosomal protein S21
MIKARLRPGENIDYVLRRFKRACEKEGVIRDLKRIQFYEKPTEQRRRERLRKKIRIARARRFSSAKISKKRRR